MKASFQIHLSGIKISPVIRFVSCVGTMKPVPTGESAGAGLGLGQGWALCARPTHPALSLSQESDAVRRLRGSGSGPAPTLPQTQKGHWQLAEIQKENFRTTLGSLGSTAFILKARV